MSAGSYIAGVAFIVALGATTGAAAHVARKRVWPALSGPVGTLVDTVGALGLVTVSAHVAGAVGLFGRFGLITSGVLCAGCLVAVTRSARPRAWSDAGALKPDERRHKWGRLSTTVAVGAAIAVVAQYAQRIAYILDRGITELDSVYYHLPNAAAFYQTHSLLGLHYSNPDAATAFHPANGELFHAIGFVAFGSDALSPFLNVGWLAVALLASWCIGRPFGASPATLTAGALALSVPIYVDTQAATAQVDLAGLAMLMAAAAIVVSTSAPSALIVAGTAAGFAVGTKLTFVPPVLVLAAGAVAASERSARARAIAAWAVPLVATAGLWYVRNFVEVWNPIPALSSIGPISLPGPDLPMLDTLGHALAEYATDPSVWRLYVGEGIGAGFGRVWLPLVVLAMAGMVLALVRPRARGARSLGLAAVIAGLTYLVTPYTAMGRIDHPIEFAVGLRFLMPSFALGLCLLPCVGALARPSRQAALLALFLMLGVVNATTEAAYISWPDSHRLATLVVALVLVGTAASYAFVRRRSPRLRQATTAACLAAALAAGWPLLERYADNRYRDRDRFPAYEDVWTWASRLTNARIAVSGFIPVFPLYGRDLSNRVEYMGLEHDDGSFTPMRTCTAWQTALRAGRFRYVVVEPYDPDTFLLFFSKRKTAPEETWTRRFPGAHLLFRVKTKAVYDLGSVSKSEASTRSC